MYYNWDSLQIHDCAVKGKRVTLVDGISSGFCQEPCLENSCRYNTKPYEGNQIPETPGHVRSVVINKKGGFLLGSRTIARATYKEIIMAKLANPRLSNKEIAAHMGRAFATVKTADAIRLEFEKAGMEGL